MSITREEVKHLADLARLALSEDEAVKAERELEAVLGYVERLQKIDTHDVEPFAMPAKAEGWRRDEESVCDDLTRELILGNFPARKNDLLSVPAIFENPKNRP